MRIAACHLYAQIYERLNDEKRAVVRKKFAKLVKDDTPMVRWGSAQAMATLSLQLEKDLIGEYLLPLLADLLKDKNDSVKVHAVQSSVTVGKLLQNPPLLAKNIIPALKQAEKNPSWRLRFAVAENAGQLAKYLEQSSVDTQILPFYTDLMTDKEAEVRSEAVNRIPELAECATPALIVQKILPTLKLSMVSEQSQHVVGSMAYAVCKLGEQISQ